MGGDFDPLSQDDINRLKIAKESGDWLIVGLNSDTRISARNGVVYIPYEHRCFILSNLKYVDEVIINDGQVNDDRYLLIKVKNFYPGANFTYFSDGNIEEKPESKVTGVKFATFNDDKT